MAAPFWILLLPLIVLGGFAAIVALVVLAIVKNRPGMVAAIGGGLLLLVIGGLLLSFLAFRSTAHVASTEWHVGPVNFAQNFDDGSSSRTVSWEVSWVGLMFVIALPILLLFAFARMLGARQHEGQRCGGIGLGWVVMGLVFLGLIGLFGAKWFAAQQSARNAQQQALMALKAAEAQARVQRKSIDLQRQAAEMSDKVRRQIAEMDIHELMDKVDAPKIPLPPPSSAPVATPTLPTPPQPSAPNVVAVAETRSAKADDVDADVATEAQAAVAAIAEDNASDGEATSVAGKSDEESKSTNSETSANETPASDQSRDAAPAADHGAVEKAVSEQPAAEKPAVKSAESPAAEAAAPEPAQTPRPSWVDAPPRKVGEKVQEVIVTDEYASVDECTRATDVYLLLKTYEHLQELVGKPVFDASLPSISFSGRTVMGDGRVILSSDGGRTWNWFDPRILYLSSLGIGVDYVRREIVAQNDAQPGESRQYFEKVERSFGPMYRLYTQIEFTPSVDKELRRRWEVGERDERLAAVGLGAGGILGLLGLVYGLLRVDTWTKGYYSKRLFIGVPAAIIGLGTLLVMLVDWLG